VNSELEMNSLF